MTSALDDLARRFRFNETIVAGAIADLDDEEWSRRAGERGGNSAHWILGHVVGSRRLLLRRLGEALVEDGWEKDFSFGATPDDPSGYPAPDVLLEELAACGERLAARLGSLSNHLCGEEWGIEFPDGSRTVGEGAHFLYMHECYHVGQLGLLRRINGRPGFI